MFSIFTMIFCLTMAAVNYFCFPRNPMYVRIVTASMATFGALIQIPGVLKFIKS